jgi:L-lactate dehydrogenase complex protein LldE
MQEQMKVGLFIPCYIDQFYPRVAISVHQFLKNQNLELDYPMDQTCCGQPLANSGMKIEAEKYADKFQNIFSRYDYVVCPSASCVFHVRNHYDNLPESGQAGSIGSKTFEFVEFLHDVLEIKHLNTSFPHKVALIHSCHGLRGLRLEVSSELKIPYYSKNLNLLKQIKGIKLISYPMEDECCGFGGTFSVFEETLSVQMGLDKLQAILATGAEYVTGNDMSCLMHLEGLAKRNKLDLKFLHIAEILTHRL